MFPRRLARINRTLTNRLLRPAAAVLPPFAVMEHQGRRTGRAYRTPVFAFRHGPDIVVVLSYGRDSDWVRNLLAAGSGSVVRAGRRARLTDVRVVPVADVPGMSPLGRFSARAGSHALIATTSPPVPDGRAGR